MVRYNIGYISFGPVQPLNRENKKIRIGGVATYQTMLINYLHRHRNQNFYIKCSM